MPGSNSKMMASLSQQYRDFTEKSIEMVQMVEMKKSYQNVIFALFLVIEFKPKPSSSPFLMNSHVLFTGRENKETKKMGQK